MIKNIAHILYHVMVVLLSAALVLSVPYLASSLAGRLLRYWAVIEDEKVFLVTLEISMAVALIVIFQYDRTQPEEPEAPADGEKRRHGAGSSGKRDVYSKEEQKNEK